MKVFTPKIKSGILILILFLTFGFSPQNKSVNHAIWHQVLQKYVSAEGNVNYKSLKNNRKELDTYLKLLQANHPQSSWTEQERLAYWINAYNAFTVDLILQHYPVKSIRDIGGLIKIPGVQSAWDISFIVIEGKKYSLGDIEHKILRKEFNEPRIHFAINCASYSCPKLINQAFTAAKIEEQLQQVSIDFINDKQRNSLAKDKVILSKIFDWYKSDFTADGKTLIQYINQFSKIKINNNAKLTFAEYNWNLNE